MKNQNLDTVFSELSKLKVAVIGDVMLDTYWWGQVDRISPEAPVPIVSLQKKEKRIGGAGNVALNALELGAHIAVISILGIDEDGNEIKEMLQEKGIDHRFIITSRKRITTNKTRIISRNQQMMRLDAEITDDLEKDDEEKLLGIIEKYLNTEHPDVVILEDYNKGIFTPGIIRATIELCNKAGVIVTVDPKRKNFFEYRNVALFKPNLHEVLTALNILNDTVSLDWLRKIHSQLYEKLNHTISLITLSDKGMFYGSQTAQQIIPAHRREIADVSGAGDTVIAVASLVYASTKDIDLAAKISNIAGGLVCEEVGTVPINKNRLLEESKRIFAIGKKMERIS